MYNRSLTHVDKKYYSQSNEADSERYKAGFDGGVDIIAKFDVVKPICRNLCFYIQCKCHKEPLTKSAISEVYAGMHARKGTTVTSLPVPYGNYGNLMRVILYHYTKDVVWIKTLPESQPALGIQSMRYIVLWIGF